MANNPADRIVEIRGMRFPKPFIDLWNTGKWQQPANHLVTELIPWLQGPIEFIETMDWMVTENRGSPTEHSPINRLLHTYRGSTSVEKPDLPWLDIDQALLFAVNRIHGDDLAIAMDFRTSLDDPRVVASYWCTDPPRTEWRLVTLSFREFLNRLELVCP